MLVKAQFVLHIRHVLRLLRSIAMLISRESGLNGWNGVEQGEKIILLSTVNLNRMEWKRDGT